MTTTARFSIPRDATLLTRAELERMRRAAGFRDDIEAEEKEKKERTLKALKDIATLRKTKLMSRDKDSLRHQELSDMEHIRSMARNNEKEAAEEEVNEGTDEAKNMNSCMQYARAANARESQREEKKQIKQEERNNDIRWANLMEADRVRDLTERENLEKKKAQERREGAKEIIIQIRDRKLERSIQGEARQREEEERVKRMELDRLEDIEEKKKRAIRVREMQEEMAVENSKFRGRKAEAKAKDLAEEQKMLAYMREQEAIEADKEAARVQRQKEDAIRTAKFREEYERSVDAQAIKDEAAMKRAFDEKERKAIREKKAEDEKRARAVRECTAVREQQILAKQAALEEQVIRDRAEFDHIVRANREEIEKYEATKARTREAANDNKTGVLGQILEHVEKKRRERDDQLIEGEAERRAERERTATLQALKEKKIAVLRAENISEKYIYDLKKVKV